MEAGDGVRWNGRVSRVRIKGHVRLYKSTTSRKPAVDRVPKSRKRTTRRISVWREKERFESPQMGVVRKDQKVGSWISGFGRWRIRGNETQCEFETLHAGVEGRSKSGKFFLKGNPSIIKRMKVRREKIRQRNNSKARQGWPSEKKGDVALC